MRATQDLRAEHVGVIRMLDVLEVMAAQARVGKGVDQTDLAQAMEFLRVFVDQCHHAKEEVLLFPAMRAANIASAEAAIERLLAEHETARSYTTRLAALADRVNCDDATAGPDLAEAISDYSALLRGHIVLEESECFDPADATLPQVAQDELEKGYERIERDVIGAGRHKEFHELLERLEVKYIPTD